MLQFRELAKTEQGVEFVDMCMLSNGGCLAENIWKYGKAKIGQLSLEGTLTETGAATLLVNLRPYWNELGLGSPKFKLSTGAIVSDDPSITFKNIRPIMKIFALCESYFDDKFEILIAGQPPKQQFQPQNWPQKGKSFQNPMQKGNWQNQKAGTSNANIEQGGGFNKGGGFGTGRGGFGSGGKGGKGFGTPSSESRGRNAGWQV